MIERYKLIHGDCLEKLKELEDNSVDAIITDPPYCLSSQRVYSKQKEINEIKGTGKLRANIENNSCYGSIVKGFMGKEWDNEIAFNPKVWEESLRVLKPAGHLLSFGGTRTYHRMTCAIEDAGYEVRDCLAWIYGSGFPKSQNISQMYEKDVCRNEFIKEFGRKPEIIKDEEGKIIKDEFKEYWESWRIKGERNPNSRENCTKENTIYGSGTVGKTAYYFIPKTEFGKEWEGWGTALKPAFEPIVLARKPLSEKTIAENVLKWGTGGLNIDGSRVGFVNEEDKKQFIDDSNGINRQKSTNAIFDNSKIIGNHNIKDERINQGRFPANVILDEEAGRLLDLQSGITKSSDTKRNRNTIGSFGMPNDNTPEYSDKGGASRFFYCAKASKSERNAGLEINNSHPTLKPTKLLEYLIKLTTKENQVVLDMFMGSGSTGVACMNLGRRFVGIELEEEYFKIAEARIENASQQKRLFE